MPRSITLNADSPFLDSTCALCKEAFAPGDEIVICPEDAARHHVDCWQANHNHCSAYGCTGHGLIGEPAYVAPLEGEIIRGRGRSKVRTMPSVRFGCGRGCCFVIALLTTLLLAASCFGLWSLAERLIN